MRQPDQRNHAGILAQQSVVVHAALSCYFHKFKQFAAV
jgi:hypothetical protein